MKPNNDLDIRRRPEQERSKDTVNVILVAARALFGERGIDVVSMTQIAAQAGMSKPALYRYFPNKQSIIRELAENDLRQNSVFIENLLQTPFESPQALLLEGVRAYCRLHIDEPYRLKLRAAIHADPQLAALDLIDSRENAQLLGTFIEASFPGFPKDSIQVRTLLFSELIDSLTRLVVRVDEDEAENLIREFIDLFSKGFTRG